MSAMHCPDILWTVKEPKQKLTQRFTKLLRDVLECHLVLATRLDLQCPSNIAEAIKLDSGVRELTLTIVRWIG